MSTRDADSDAAAERLERRWFAAFKAASRVRAECEALLDAMQITEDAWNQARMRLVELEALRDALGAQLEGLDQEGGAAQGTIAGEEMSAA